jgi:large repetitive protein
MEPGDVKFIVKYQNDRFESDVMTYTYFASPVLNEDPLSPSCGPVEGFTQITVRGKNFVEFHFGQAKCIFNGTMFMNATVLNSDTMVCDSPTLDTTNPEMWYNISVTLDGNYRTNASAVFKYYREPTISSISPVRGPIAGGTDSVIHGKGFN